MPGHHLSAIPENFTEIGDHTYHVHFLPATKARKMLARIVGGLEAVKGDAEMISAIGALVRRAEDQGDLDYLCRELGSVTIVDLKKEKGGYQLTEAMQDTHFQGRVGDLFQWLYFALKVQFGDFLSDALAKVQAAGAFEFPTTWTGGSGDQS